MKLDKFYKIIDKRNLKSTFQGAVRQIILDYRKNHDNNTPSISYTVAMLLSHVKADTRSKKAKEDMEELLYFIEIAEKEIQINEYNDSRLLLIEESKRRKKRGLIQ